MTQKPIPLSRTRCQHLIKRLIAQVGAETTSLYVVALLRWGQLITKLLTFAIIAKGFSAIYQRKGVDYILIVSVILLLTLCGVGLTFLTHRYQGRASQYARNQLKMQFFNKVKHHAHESHSTLNEMLMIAAHGIESFDRFYSQCLMKALTLVTHCVTVLALVILIYPMGGLIFVVSGVMMSIVFIVIQRYSRDELQSYWESYVDIGAVFMDYLNGLNTLYTYGADEAYEQQFADKAEKFREKSMEMQLYQLQSVGYMESMMFLGIGVSGFFAVMAVSQGELSIFGMIFFMLLAVEFFVPIRQVMTTIPEMRLQLNMADRVFAFLDDEYIQASDNKAQDQLDLFESNVNKMHTNKLNNNTSNADKSTTVSNEAVDLVALLKPKHATHSVGNYVPETLDAHCDEAIQAEAIQLHDSISTIDFQEVSFAFEHQSPIIQQLTTHFERGQLYAIAGMSGSGKSTLRYILQGVLKPTHGQVLMNGVSVLSLSQSDYEQAIMTVSPESYVFSGSIMENLKLGTTLSDDAIKTMLSRQSLLQFVQTLPDGFETQVGENARWLSPGQRQQLIVARALLAERDVYIFDEMTASVDRDNEAEILNMIRLMSQSTIVIYISHKMSQVLLADTVLFMGKEGIVEATPTELLQSNDEFKALVATQQALEESVYVQ